jgi:cytochrome c-type biogenesis protein CcmH
MRRMSLAIVMVWLSMLPATAVQPDEVLANPTLEARARALTRELRCMVCQNQSIDDSDAPLARDLRLLVRERLQAGDSNRQVIDFLVARYGEFVLLRPRFSAHTAILWFTPLGILLVGAVVFVLVGRRARTSETNLTPQEEARVSEILRRNSSPESQPNRRAG